MNLTYDILNIHREGNGMFCLVGRFTLHCTRILVLTKNKSAVVWEWER